MATETATRTRRIFMVGEQRLADPDPALTPQEVKRHYATSRPELTTASCTLIKTETKDGVKTETWQLKASAGTKG